MKLKKYIEEAQFMIMKNDDTYSVCIDIKDHMKELFIKHKDSGYVCCGYDWCTLLIAFMYHNEYLKDLWYVFDYEPTDDQLCISSKNGVALHRLMEEFGNIYNDVDFIEHLMMEIDYKNY